MEFFFIPTVIHWGWEWPHGWLLPDSCADGAIKAMQSTRSESPIYHRDGRRLRPPPLGRKAAVRRWMPLAAGGLSLAASFFTTLYLIEPHLTTTPAVATVMQARISSTQSLLTAIKTAGLKGSTNVKGTIDEVKRLDDSQVAISGWAAEIGNSGTPLTVLAFVDGKVALAMRTSGRHTGVVSVLGASDAPEAVNVTFQGTARCTHGQKLIVIAVTDGNSYGHFGTRDCP